MEAAMGSPSNDKNERQNLNLMVFGSMFWLIVLVVAFRWLFMPNWAFLTPTTDGKMALMWGMIAFGQACIVLLVIGIVFIITEATPEGTGVLRVLRGLVVFVLSVLGPGAAVASLLALSYLLHFGPK